MYIEVRGRSLLDNRATEMTLSSNLSTIHHSETTIAEGPGTSPVFKLPKNLPTMGHFIRQSGESRVSGVFHLRENYVRHGIGESQVGLVGPRPHPPLRASIDTYTYIDI